MMARSKVERVRNVSYSVPRRTGIIHFSVVFKGSAPESKKKEPPPPPPEPEEESVLTVTELFNKIEDIVSNLVYGDGTTVSLAGGSSDNLHTGPGQVSNTFERLKKEF